METASQNVQSFNVHYDRAQPSFPLDSSSGVSSSVMPHPAVSTKISGMLVRDVAITPGSSLKGKYQLPAK